MRSNDEPEPLSAGVCWEIDTNRPSPKVLTVLNTEHITPNMHRIRLKGELADSPNWSPGCYVKLLLPDQETGKMDLGGPQRPKVRTYTARTFNLDEQTITIDFAIHEPAGPATNWATNAKVGDEVGLMGPGPLKPDTSKGDWYLFAADMVGLSAAISVMESLDEHAKGYAFL